MELDAGATGTVVVFRLDGRSYALPLTQVERVIPRVALTPLPSAPPIVLGVIDDGGRLLPAVDVRGRFGLPAREPALEDRILLAKSTRRVLAIIADEVDGVRVLCPGEAVSPEEVAPGLRYVAGVVRTPEGILLIHDLDTFLSLDEAEALDEALRGGV
jgi:purine-binding chemotaxis protein CheW